MYKIYCYPLKKISVKVKNQACKTEKKETMNIYTTNIDGIVKYYATAENAAKQALVDMGKHIEQARPDIFNNEKMMNKINFNAAIQIYALRCKETDIAELWGDDFITREEVIK